MTKDDVEGGWWMMDADDGDDDDDDTNDDDDDCGGDDELAKGTPELEPWMVPLRICSVRQVQS